MESQEEEKVHTLDSILAWTAAGSVDRTWILDNWSNLEKLDFCKDQARICFYRKWKRKRGISL